MEYEFVTFDNDLPVKIILHPVEGTHVIPRHWHESVEVSYVLSGIIDTIYIDGASYTAKQGDITVINSNEVHSFSVDSREEGTALTILISYEFLKVNYPDIDLIAFECISNLCVEEERTLRFRELRDNLDEFVTIYQNPEAYPFAPIKIRGLAYELIYLLLRDFMVKKKNAGNIKSQKHLYQLTEITNFIKDNYSQPLSIAFISNHFRFTPEYLCRFFRKHIGMTIFQYINAIRLEKSFRDLIHTDRSITQIAYDNGFSNVKSFNRVFKEFYKTTPAQYRKL